MGNITDNPASDSGQPTSPRHDPGPRDHGAAWGLGAPAAHLTAWLSLAGVNMAIAVATSFSSASGTKAAFAGCLYEVGTMATAGLLSSAAVAIWARSRIGARVRAMPVLFALAAAVGLASLRDDLGGAAHRLLDGRSSNFVLVALVLAVSAAVPSTARLAARCRLPLARGAWALGALGLAAANHFLLRRTYPGIHLMTLWVAAVALGVALTAVLPPPASSARRRAFDAARALSAALGAWTLVVPPSPQALVFVLSHSGCALAPYVASARSRMSPHAAPAVQEGAWFIDRTGLPDVPSSSPPLVDSPIVLLLTIDAARWDLVVGEQYRQALPTLHQLRDEGVHFKRAVAPGNETLSSLAGLMTGKYVSQLRWSPRRKGLGLWKQNLETDESVRFPQIITDSGIPSVLLASSPGLYSNYGICRGFTEQTRPGWYSDKIVAAAARRLEQVGPEGLLLYAHFMDSHGPYDAAGESGTMFERYLREVGLVDRQLGLLVDTVDTLGLSARTIFIVSSDHGEAFGEHNSTEHGTTLYREQVQIPLIVRGPSINPREVDDWVSLLDLGPTIIDLMGRPTPASFFGQSLVPYLRGEPEVELRRPVALQTAQGQTAMYFVDELKIVEDRSRGLVELYELATDPGELNNLYDPSSAAHRARLDELRAFFAAQ